MKKVSAIQKSHAQVTENGVMKSNEILQVYTPKINFQGGSIKWYEDKPRKSTTH